MPHSLAGEGDFRNHPAIVSLPIYRTDERSRSSNKIPHAARLHRHRGHRPAVVPRISWNTVRARWRWSPSRTNRWAATRHSRRRRSRPRPSPPGIPVYQPEKIGDATAELAALDPEVLVVMAYGQILRKNILTLASKAIINLHASLLPKYRGAACIQAAIDAGDAESGITAMHVVRELDAGDIILAKSIPIAADETGGTLHDRLADLAAEVLGETLAKLADGTAPRIPQDAALVSYIPKLERDDGRLDWNMPAAALERRIRAYDPWPGTFTTAIEGGKEKRLKIYPPTRVVDANSPPAKSPAMAANSSSAAAKEHSNSPPSSPTAASA